MEKIASFTINHLKLLPGVYVSRKDAVGSETLTTFDLRMTAPNREPVMNTAEMHAIEHLAATYLRNNKEWQDKIIYFGPMGCRTGFYLIEFIRDFKGDVPGASAKDCGNYLDMNLSMANYLADHYLKNALYVADDKNLNYPE